MIAERPHESGELTSFVGRRRELDRIRSALATGRLLTLTGPGGVGNSRLAARAMTALATALSTDVAFRVELAGVARPALVAQSVAASLDLRDDSGRWPVAMIVERLRSHDALLVLDNCEHLLDACAVLADALLRACPELRILATSRQPLGIDGEVVLSVPPLSVPAAGADALPGALVTSEAMRPFIDRARAAAPDFALDADSTAAIAELCRRLDGVPLAIELAAVRLRGLTAGELLGLIDHRLHVLTGGSRSALPPASHPPGDDRLELRAPHRSRIPPVAATVGLSGRLRPRRRARGGGGRRPGDRGRAGDARRSRRPVDGHPRRTALPAARDPARVRPRAPGRQWRGDGAPPPAP